MKMTANEKFDGKRILIWGFGREGQSSKNFFERVCKCECVDVFEGKREDIDEEKYDYIVKSPGIVMEEDHPKYTSQTEIFLEAHRDKVIGITGTKGKSTTSSMMYHVLTKCFADKKVFLLGNIGEPCLDYYDETDEDTVVVFEMSCHQLCHTKVSPRVAVFLNLYEEHLDYYKTMEKYFAAKANVALYQRQGDYFYVGENVPSIETKAQVRKLIWQDVPEYNLKVLGYHNNYNANCVYRIATEVYGLKADEVTKALSQFDGLSHRLEYAGRVDEIDYYDDSISTIPNATIQALGAVKNAATVLIGGMDRGICYDNLIDFINANSQYNYIFSYDSGKRIYDSINKSENCYYRDDLKKAVELAKEITPAGCACILSPAAASYGYFKNFEQRGDAFKELVGLR